jgi:hypothetical protein
MYLLSILLALALTCSAQEQLPGFAPPALGSLATGGELGSPFSVPDAATCAAACTANASCISFSTVPAKQCGIVGECYAPNASSCPATLALSCPGGVFSSVLFASYGTPQCAAGQQCAFTAGNCSAPSSAAVLAQACVGKSYCAVEVGVKTFGADPCPGVYKFLAAQLAGTGCSAGGLSCQLSQYSRTYAIASGASANATYYQRLLPRNDTHITQAVPYALDVPTGGVTLGPGPLQVAFDTGIQYLLGYNVSDLLFNFRKRAGLPQPPGAHCVGWDCREDWLRAPWLACFSWAQGGTCAGRSTLSCAP